MPKNFDINTKSLAAKECKQSKKIESQLKAKQAAENVYWQDNDKLIKKREERKQQQIKKHEIQLQRKTETKLALEEEVAALLKSSTRKSKPQPTEKTTQAKIESVKKIVDDEKVKKKISKNNNNTETVDYLLVENVNKLNIDVEEARSVTKAIEILTLASNDREKLIDKHPEKRRKAAYSAFEKRRLNELKLEKPSLKLSQLKQVVFKEWQMSPENPLNR